MKVLRGDLTCLRSRSSKLNSRTDVSDPSAVAALITAQSAPLVLVSRGFCNRSAQAFWLKHRAFVIWPLERSSPKPGHWAEGKLSAGLGPSADSKGASAFCLVRLLEAVRAPTWCLSPGVTPTSYFHDPIFCS